MAATEGGYELRPGKRRKNLLIIVFITLLVVAPLVYVQTRKFVYAHRVTSYLKEEKGYSSQDIASVQGVWGMKAPPFFVVVKFRDEPEVEYVYFAHDGVMQFSHSITRRGMRQGIERANLKHLDEGISGY
ncbi:hypothetical protein C2I18_03035 [Paenibacillus sp. PK3_47]|uniref:DUF3139 domain-containing protein n=1 Tax=Paenibacillus sp. PK3_47 TaxID=2072642 RepID=UPI00201D92A4|nr:DUF3139 domain-containing protein [Paenibacillus sp. PK3_47]UQZ32621.1 hypothetical protein C2I18_03035 [Paenibacillus sp. PK3_47]